MKKTKKTKSLNAWKRVYIKALKNRKLDCIQHDVEVCTRIHGRLLNYELFKFEQKVFHEVVLPMWKQSTYVENRNTLLEAVRGIFGNGYANELQRTSARRTWK